LLVCIVLAASLFLWLQNSTEKVYAFGDGEYKIYKYKDSIVDSYSATIAQGVDSIWQEILIVGKEWTKMVDSITPSSILNGYGYVAVISLETPIADINIEGKTCKVEAFVDSKKAITVSDVCKNATSILTHNTDETWLAIDLKSVLEKVVTSTSDIIGRTYVIDCYVDNKLIITITGVFS